MRNVPNYIEEVNKEDMRAQAYMLSELLVNDAGEPANWDSVSEIKRIGLSNQTENRTNFLSLNKINKLNSICQLPGGSEKVQKLTGMNRPFSLMIFKVDQNTGNRENIAQCEPSQAAMLTNTTVKRYAVYGNEIAEIIIQV